MRRGPDTIDSSGRTIGRYHLHRQIARGGMARIHIARSIGAEGFSRIVAAKRLDPELATDAEFVAMFLDEARVASKVRHRNVVPVLDVITIDGEVIMVQELVHGVPLHKLSARAQLANVRIPIEIAVSIAAQVLAGLHAAHEAVDETGMSLNIVHRDVSPQNVMIASDGTACLLDFGVAKNSASAHVTQTGTFKGKLAYSSPEQLAGNVERQTDIYALGIVLWELLVGERMHAGRTEQQVYAATMEGNTIPITEALAPARRTGKLDDTAWRKLKALAPIVQRALSREASDRYATALDMERALLAAVEPAPLSDVAIWLRSLAQDMLDETERLIADEEDSWRKAKGSGCLPAMFSGVTGPHLPRSSTDLETQAGKPSTLSKVPRDPVRDRPPTRLDRAMALVLLRIPRHALRRHWVPALSAMFGIALALLLSLMFATSSRARTATASPSAPNVAPIWMTPSTAEANPPETAITQAPKSTRVAPTKRTATTPSIRPIVRHRSVKRGAVVRKSARIDCSIPFYYEGRKKIFKPSCI